MLLHPRRNDVAVDEPVLDRVGLLMPRDDLPDGERSAARDLPAFRHDVLEAVVQVEHERTRGHRDLDPHALCLLVPADR